MLECFCAEEGFSTKKIKTGEEARVSGENKDLWWAKSDQTANSKGS